LPHKGFLWSCKVWEASSLGPEESLTSLLCTAVMMSPFHCYLSSISQIVVIDSGPDPEDNRFYTQMTPLLLGHPSSSGRQTTNKRRESWLRSWCRHMDSNRGGGSSGLDRTMNAGWGEAKQEKRSVRFRAAEAVPNLPSTDPQCLAPSRNSLHTDRHNAACEGVISSGYLPLWSPWLPLISQELSPSPRLANSAAAWIHSLAFP
jgi:hypothetical protein